MAKKIVKKPKVITKKQTPSSDSGDKVTAFKQALKDLGLKPSDVQGHHEYSETSIVIVTIEGKKMLWGNKPPVDMNFSKVVPCGGQENG